MERQQRYLVLKISDVDKYLNEDDRVRLARIARDITAARAEDSRPYLEAVVVEHDWPEYEPVWQMIDRRVETDKP